MTVFIDFFFEDGEFSHRNFDSSKHNTPIVTILNKEDRHAL